MGAIANIDIQGCVITSITEIFRRRLSMEMALRQEDPPPTAGTPRIAVTLAFAGKVGGIVTLQTSADFGRILASAAFRAEPDAIDLGSAAKEFIADITASVGGNLKSALTAAGIPCVLSPPVITFGSDFTIDSLKMDRFERFVFRKDDHILCAEVALKDLEGAETGFDFSAEEAASGTSNRDPARLNALDIRHTVSRSLAEVCEAMFALKLEAVEMASGDKLSGMRRVSSVCVIGDARGIVSICIDSELCRRLGDNRRGRPSENIEGEDEIGDVLGRLGGIVGGNLKSALTESGLRCDLSAPFFTAGSDFTIEAPNLQRYERLAFQAEGHTLFVETGISFGEPATAALLAGTGSSGPKADPGGRKIPSAADGTRSAQDNAGRPKEPATQPVVPAPEDFGLEILLDIPVELTVELGRTRMPIRELLQLQPGSAVKLARLEGEPVDILAGEVLIARGEVVVRNEKYGIRITEITSRMERLKGLK
jgi:flagellar motor switch protein FliN/FliY